MKAMGVQSAVKVNRSAARQPSRRSGSLRRTSSIQSFWPSRPYAVSTMVGRARDLFTGADPSRPLVLGTDWIKARLDADRCLVELDASRHQDVVKEFGGLAPGGPMRKAMARTIPQEAASDTLLHRLLDDMAGGSFLSTAAWFGWPGGIDGYHAETGSANVMDRAVEGLCLSFVPGSAAISETGGTNEALADHPEAPTPIGTDDAHEWHELASLGGPNQWRLRRTDLWREDDALLVDAWFQDSSLVPERSDRRFVFHEYSVRARLDLETLVLQQVEVDAHVLPFLSCRAAPRTARELIGVSATDLRSQVPQLLGGTRGCTHLNDMYRSLQDVAAMAGLLALAEEDAPTSRGG